MGSSDTVPVSAIPKSARGGNELQLLSDGLYVGSQRDALIYYVGSNGADVPTNGRSSAQPWLTLDYALAQLKSMSNGVFNFKAALALRAGESFTLGSNFEVAGILTIGFWGSNFGDFSSPLVGTGALPAVLATLNRPIITPQSTVINGRNSIFGFSFVSGSSGQLELQGIQVNLPAAIANQPSLDSYGYCDFVRSNNYSKGTLSLVGTIVNITDPGSVWGLLGVDARVVCSLTGFASQFRVQNVNVGAGASSPALLARQNFVKMYPDMPGNKQPYPPVSVLPQVADSSNSSSGSGILMLNWSDTPSLVVEGSNMNLNSYPPVFDVTYGIRNYFSGLTRDQQQRPLNVISSRLF